MRWFVEISTLGRNSVQSPTLCVEAPQWQPALQKARALRGDDAAMSNFSVELLDDGYRAVDPASRLRYVVRRAPDDADLTPEGGPAPAPAAPAAPAAARAVAETLDLGSVGSAIVREPAPKAVDFRILSVREDNPSERSPLIYRECVVAVPAGTSEDAAAVVILDRFRTVRDAIRAARPGKLVNLAVFDHVFEGRPSRRPLVTLTWKDWKGEEPELRYPLREGSGSPPAGADAASKPAAPPAAAASSSPAPAASSAKTADSTKSTESPKSAEPAKGAVSTKQTESSSAASASGGSTSSKPVPAPAKAAPTPAKAAPAAAKSPSKPAKRLSGDELISELFEASSDLHFLRDTLEGADFILTLTREKLPCEVCLISLFDINKREFVVVRQAGGPTTILLAKLAEKAGLADVVMRSHRAVVVREAGSDARIAADKRWSDIGVVPRSVVCAPVEVGGRYLGLIEIANPSDGRPFDDGDGNALLYIGQQFAEFVAAQGIVLDRDAILAASKNAPR